MTPSEFSELLERYRNGLATPEEIRKLEAWYAYIEQEEENIPAPVIAELKNRGLAKIMAGGQPAASRTSATRRLVITTISVAASLLLAISFFYFNPEKGETGKSITAATHPGKGQEQSFFNRGTANKLVVLEDGSAVLLSPGSSLICLKGFGLEHRKTKLSGDAFFEISHDPTLPFFVLCEEILTKVLGTSFWIRSFSESRSVEVTVHSGKVSVFKKNPSGEPEKKHEIESLVTLLPNQKASFSTKPVIGKIKELPVAVAVQPDKISLHNYIFQKATLAEVFHTISLQYGLSIRLDVPNPANCTFTGDISDLALLEKLEIIRFSTGTSFEIKESELVITGKGCE